MKITKRTRMRDIAPLLTDERTQELARSCPAVPLRKPLLQMSVGEFVMALEEGFALSLLTERRALVAFGRFRSYLEELELITRYIKSYEVKPTADERKASEGVRFPSLGERILLDCVRVYGLHSTEEAERMPISDWLLVVKNEGSAAQYQRRMDEIYRSRQKGGKR